MVSLTLGWEYGLAIRKLTAKPLEAFHPSGSVATDG